MSLCLKKLPICIKRLFDLRSHIGRSYCDLALIGCMLQSTLLSSVAAAA